VLRTYRYLYRKNEQDVTLISQIIRRRKPVSCEQDHVLLYYSTWYSTSIYPWCDTSFFSHSSGFCVLAASLSVETRLWNWA
jgi:hypothetical protein